MKPNHFYFGNPSFLKGCRLIIYNLIQIKNIHQCTKLSIKIQNLIAARTGEHGDSQQQSCSLRGKELQTVPTLLPQVKLRT